MRNQNTIEEGVHFEGVCAHSGDFVKVTLEPAPDNTGVVFIRDDVQGNNTILASYKNTIASPLCTQIRNDSGVEVRTIEHLLSALYAKNIDNVFVHITGNEVPILDGSALPMLELLDNAEEQNTKKLCLRIKKEIECRDTDKYVRISPYDGFIVEVECDFTKKGLGKETYTYNHSFESYASDIAPSRTFGFYEDAEMLKAAGLAKGSSLDNTVVFKDGACINDGGLRSPNEHIKHKVLDAIGDLSVCGYDIIGRFYGFCPGHKINGELVKKIFSDTANFEIV